MTYHPNESLRKKLDIAAYIISVAVIALVVYMRPAERYSVDFDTMWMPAFNALVNSLAGICLLTAVYFVKKKNITAHRNMIFLAMLLSAAFLVVYVIYHFTTPETTYCKEGAIRYVYYFFLITHIVLAGISLPFILLTFNRGFTYSVMKHKKLAKWVFPLWLYVVFTGPIVYLLLKPCYGV